MTIKKDEPLARYLHDIAQQLKEITIMLQEILTLFTRISTALDAINAKLQGFAGGLSATDATQIRDAATVLADKTEQLAK